MSITPVSHQWFVQWSPPVAIQNSQIPPQDGRNSDTENWARQAVPAQYSWETFHLENQPDRTSYDSGRNNYASRSPFRRPGRPQLGETDVEAPNQANRPLDRKPYDGRQGSSVYRLLPTMALLFAGAPAQEPPGAPPFRTMFQWRSIDFQFPTDIARQQAINENQFIPENVIPLGIEAWRDKVFLTFPRWLGGVPASLGYVSKDDNSDSPLIRAYPDWDSHVTGDGQCDGFTSVFRVATDDCNRLWILDSGQIDALTNPKQACPPQLSVVDLETDKLIARFPLPDEFVLQNSLYSNIVADSRDSQCTNLHIYMTDVWRFGILVFRESDSKFWRFNSHLFYPDPLASDFTLHGVNFQWSDGVFGLSLGPLDAMGDRVLYFHPMASYREFRTQVSFLRNEKNVGKNPHALRVFGESRGKDGHTATSAIDRDGVMFSSLVSRDSIGCWDTRKPYTRQTAVTLANNNETLVFPNDLKIDREPIQTIWVITNRLPIFLYSKLDLKDYNYRVIYADAKDAIKGTVCDPNLQLTGKQLIENEWVDECH